MALFLMLHEMKITNLREHPEFIPTLAVWQHNQWAYLNPGDSVEGRIASLTAQSKSDEIPQTFVAFSGDTLLGSAALIPHDMETRMELSPWLASVFVAVEQRNKGIGAELVRRVMKESALLGHETIYLFTPDRESFYTRLGWSLLERTEYRGHQVTIMTAISTAP